MLALDSRIQGSVVGLRHSMMKFPSNDMHTLEICDMGSNPHRFYLNRQIIKILEDMGVSNSWFINLQNAQVAMLRGVTTSMENTTNFLRRYYKTKQLGLPKLVNKLSTLGIDFKDDCLLCSTIEALVLHELRLLKHRARIEVDKGATLFGVMDETGFLQENEVFVTFDTSFARVSAPPSHGTRVLVTRSPALHDGDIQAAVNVIPPKDHPLSHHQNCIVFNQKGPRDLPSQLSGGDLDGDKFNVIWDPDCVPTKIFPPADYPRGLPEDIGRPVTSADMIDFFVHFMETDRLGMIATRHMIAADQLEGGTSHPECQWLAELHSKAVDFSKTGIPVQFEWLRGPLGQASKVMSEFRPDL